MTAPDLVVTALTLASDSQLGRALVVLSRVVTDRPDLTPAARAVLDDRLPDLVRRAATDAELIDGLSAAVRLLRPQTGAVAAIDELPPITARTARLVGEIMLTAALALEEAAKETDDLLPELARVHNNLNVVFGHWREPEWAVKAGRRAVELHRTLVGQHGDEAAPGLASALSNLAVALSEVDDAVGALAAGEEAVGLYRLLVGAGAGQADPRHRRSLANALTNHSAQLAEDARLDEALSVIEEAVEVWRAHPASGEASTLAGLARALSNRSVRLGALGRHDEAIAANDEAVAIRRRLADAEPRHLADLAMTSGNRAARLGAVGRGSEALATLQEAIRMRRELVAADPEEHLPGLATSLHNLSFRLTEQQRPVAERLAASSEAVQIRRRLAARRPEAYRGGLAAALHTESVDLADAGDSAASLASAEEAVEIRRAIATDLADDDRADEHQARLASSLYNLSIAQATVGSAPSALETAQEAVEIRRSLVSRWPDAFREDLADSLGNLSSRLDGAGRTAEALAATEEALGLRRLLARADPDRHLGDLATSLNNFSVDLSRAGRFPESLAASEESVTVRRALAAASPERYRRVLALNLNNHGVSLAEVERREEAVAALAEALAIYRSIIDKDRRGVLPELVMAAGNLAEQLVALDRGDDARAVFDDVLTGIPATESWALGVARSRRGWWLVSAGQLRTAIDDLCTALVLLEGDLAQQATTRIRLRRARQFDPVGFDLAWSGRGELPVWLRHVEVTGPVIEQLRTWLDTDDLDDAEALLADRADVLLSDEARARLDHLLDANPGHRWLLLARDLLAAARARGVPAAYAEYRDRLWRDGVAQALAGWVTADPGQLRPVLDAEPVLLLSEEAGVQMGTRLAAAPDDPALLLRAGLLALSRLDGPNEAFALLADEDARRRPPGRRALTAFEPRDLARARLRAGADADDPDAAFVHAVLALVAGHGPEAEHAIVRCAELATSWDRRSVAELLTSLIPVRPDLADGLSQLRALLAEVDQS